MVTALASGAEAIIPVSEIAEALEVRKKYPEVLLAGERDGLRIQANLTGGVAFDLGNSPREFTRDKVAGKKIVITTTNGTRALRACAHAQTVLVSSFLNLQATRHYVQRFLHLHLLVICSGTFEQTALEDVLAAGAFCESLYPNASNVAYSDSVLIAVNDFLQASRNLNLVMSQSRNARRLLSRPELRDDVAYCVQRDIYDFVAAMDKNGIVSRIG
jgi:2-phosphosulfolactate phosphatase